MSVVLFQKLDTLIIKTHYRNKFNQVLQIQELFAKKNVKKPTCFKAAHALKQQFYCMHFHDHFQEMFKWLKSH